MNDIDVLKMFKKPTNIIAIKETGNKLILPVVEIKKGIGISHSSEKDIVITEKTIGNIVEHTVEIKNNTGLEIIKIGFRIQYPEYIEHPPKITGPPGFSYQLDGENMEWESLVKGGGRIEMKKVNHYGSFILEGTSLLSEEGITILIRSIPNPLHHDPLNDKSIFFISGELWLPRGKTLEKHPFVAPFNYDKGDRKISIGQVHVTNIEEDKYTYLQRAY